MHNQNFLFSCNILYGDKNYLLIKSTDSLSGERCSGNLSYGFWQYILSNERIYDGFEREWNGISIYYINNRKLKRLFYLSV